MRENKDSTFKDFGITKWIFVSLGLGCYIIYFSTTIQLIKDISSIAGGLLLITGMVDIVLRNTYLDSVIKTIINGFYLHDDSLEKMESSRIKEAIKKMYAHLAIDLKNPLIKDKILDVSTNRLLNIMTGEDEEQNSYFTKYNIVTHIREGESPDRVKAKYILEYTLVNNTNKPITHAVFMKRTFPKLSGDIPSENSQKLKSLKIRIDNQEEIDYENAIVNNQFKSVKVNNNSKVTNYSGNETTQIRYNAVDNSQGTEVEDVNFTELKITFNSEVHLSKEIELETSMKDIIIGHKFHRPILNLSCELEDETSKKITLVQYLDFIDQKNIDIKNVKPNSIRLNINDVILPGQGISFILGKNS